MSETSPSARPLLRLAGARLAAVAVLVAGCGHLFLTSKQKQEAEVHNDLGVTAFQAGRYQEAMKEFQTALEFNPDFALPHLGLGIVYMYYWTGPRLEDAKRELGKAIQLDKHLAEAWNNLGTIDAQQGDLPKAQEAFENALGEPFYKTPWIAQTNLGWVIHLQGHTEQGKQLIRQALIESPGYCPAHRQLLRILSDQGEANAADAVWEAFAKACPTEPEADFREGTIRLKHADLEGAAPWFRACVANGGSQPIADECRRALAELPPEIAAAPPEKPTLPQPKTIDLPAGTPDDSPRPSSTRPSTPSGAATQSPSDTQTLTQAPAADLPTGVPTVDTAPAAGSEAPK